VLLVCTVYCVLYSEIALSGKPFGIGHTYIYTYLLRMTDTVTSQNINLPSGTFCIFINGDSCSEIDEACIYPAPNYR
jgi:hypothetical protein